MIFQNLGHMRNDNKPTVEKSTSKNPSILIILIVALYFSLSTKENCANTFSNDMAYASKTNELIRTSLDDCQSQVVWLDGIELQTAPLICRFYESNNFEPVWTSGNELTDQSTILLELLKESYKFGFEPSNFDIQSLEHFKRLLLKEDNAKKSVMLRVRFEFLLTNSVFSFMSHLTLGTEFSNTRDAFIAGNLIISSFPEYLNEIIFSSDICSEILKIQPESTEYSSLQNEMKIIVSNMITTTNSLSIPELESEPDRVYRLFSYVLKKEGIIKEPTDLLDHDIFTSFLIKFQEYAGIRTTGNMDNATRRVISNIVRSRYEVIAYKLELIRHNSGYCQSLFSINN